MKKFVLVPDSFKGTMTSAQVCASMEAGIRRVLPQAQVVSLPVADGGEGSAEAFLTALGGQRVVRTVTGPADCCYRVLAIPLGSVWISKIIVR